MCWNPTYFNFLFTKRKAAKSFQHQSIEWLEVVVDLTTSLEVDTRWTYQSRNPEVGEVPPDPRDLIWTPPPTTQPPSCPISGVGWFKARSQAPSDWGEPAEKEEGGNGSDAASEAGARHSRVGADQDGDRSPPTHQRPGLHLETEAQIYGQCFSTNLDFFCPSARKWVYVTATSSRESLFEKTLGFLRDESFEFIIIFHHKLWTSVFLMLFN